MSYNFQRKMKCAILVILLQLLSCFEESTASLFSEEFSNLPRIFSLNETEECPEHHYYCKVNILLKPKDLDNPPEIWKLIKKQSAYRRDKIYRAICSEKKDVEVIEEKIQYELLTYNLTGEVTFSYCDHRVEPTEALGFHELLFGLLVLLYGSFIVYCTIATYYSWDSDSNEYLKIFSLINIWKDIWKQNRNTDFNNLLFVQSLRTIGILGVIGSHTTLCLMLVTFIRNPEYFEKAFNNTLFTFIDGSFTLLVQIFFIISSWLLSLQLHNIVRAKEEFTLGDLVYLWINRYLRFFPAVFLTLLFFTSDALLPLLSHPYYYSLVKTEIEVCKSDWWKNLLFFQNMQSGERMCQIGMWYLAADFQMYMTISALFYLSRRLNISMKNLLILMATSTVSIQLFGAYRNPVSRTVPNLTPKLLPLEETIRDFKKMDTYFKTYGSCVTYIIGFSFGTIYFYNKQKAIFNTTMEKLFFYSVLFSLLLLCCHVNSIELNDYLEILKTITLRPMFGLAFAILILGIATGTGGIIKKFLESKTLIFFGNFTYSIYMFHFIWVFSRAFFFPRYVEVTTYYSIMICIIDIIASFTIGIFMYVVVEHPFVKLQKKLIPRMFKQNRDAENKKE